MAFTIKSKWLIVPLLSLFSASAFSQKKIISITSKISIKAAQSDVFALLKNLERYPEWSPFVVTDPKQKHHVTGMNGELNSTFHWEGVGEKSRGFQVLAAKNNNEYIKFDCTIEKPFKGSPVFEYHLNKKNDTIELIQEFNLHLSNFSYFMTKVFSVKKKMEASNRLGLERLKNLVEKESLLSSKH